jgi:hypothetical protein
MRALIVFAAVVAAFAAPRAVSAQLPDGPGKSELLKVCGTCHPAERSVAVRLSRDGWKTLIAEMVQNGAEGTDEELKLILEYLSTHFLGEAARPLNINRATQLELESVAGLLRKEAAALLDYLKKTGPCKDLTDLKKAPGVDYKKIDDRREFLTCGPPPPKNN